MSLTVTVGVCTDDNRVVNKTYTESGTYSAVFPKEDLDIMNPDIIITTGSVDNLMTTVNYMYISELERYYYITNKKLLLGDRVQLSGSIDVLKTYSSQIEGLTALITRQENIGINDVEDKQLPLKPYRETKVLEFPESPFTNIEGENTDQRFFVLNIFGEPIIAQSNSGGETT